MVKILGIVNITPDSFSDGGKFLEPKKAIAHGKGLLAAGADILDLGPASSHPDSAAVSAKEELARLTPVLTALKKTGASLSIDSFLSSTQLYGLAEQVDYLNDISGFMDAGIYPDLARAKCALIVMHSIQSAKTGKPHATRETAPEDIFGAVCNFFDQRLSALVQAGISQDRLIIDCGWGFFLGDQPEPSLEMLRRLGALKQRFNLPILVSVSRKSFLRTLVGKGDIQAATLAAELLAAQAGADYIRTHEPAPLSAGLKAQQALTA